jgi:hypothetical protein
MYIVIITSVMKLMTKSIQPVVGGLQNNRDLSLRRSGNGIGNENFLGVAVLGNTETGSARPSPRNIRESLRRILYQAFIARLCVCVHLPTLQ